MPLESAGWFFIGAGSVILLECLLNLGRYIFFRLRKRRFAKFIDGLKATAEQMAANQATEPANEVSTRPREVSELSFRDKEGVMNTVRIIVDPSIDKGLIPDSQELHSMMESGEAGSLSELMDGNHCVSEDAMGKVQEFVFSPSAVRNMRMAGIEPDDVVTRMLKASGRMP